MSYRWERAYPLTLSLLGTILYDVFVHSIHASISNTLPAALGAAVTMGAISTGFLATALTILYTLSDRPIVNQLKIAKRQSGRSAYEDILHYMVRAIMASLAFTIYCIVCLIFVSGSSNDTTALLISDLMMFFLGYSAFALYRVVRILGVLLK